MKKALILMTRVPIPGQTKTRLLEVINKEQCAEIHFCFLKDIFNIYEIIKEDTDIFLAYTPKERFNVIEGIIPNYITTFEQVGETLGDKMKNAINAVISKGYEKVVLTGCDIPQIQVEDINIAFEKLDTKDMVIGPTEDGGYYLIGMKKSNCIVFDKNLNWGYQTVLEGTIDICKKNSIDLGITNELIDIDVKEDLIELYNQIKDDKFKIIPKHTYEFIKKLKI